MATNAKLEQQLTEYFVRTREAGHSGGRSPGARPLAIVPDTVEHPADHKTGSLPSEFNGTAARFSANGFAGWGHGAPEPVAETFPLKGDALRGHRDLPNMAHGTLGPHSVWARCRRALGVASGFSLLWPVVAVAAWAAENKLDAFGWAGLTALIADYWYPWTPKVAKLMTIIL